MWTMLPWIHCWDSSMITVAFMCTAVVRNSEFKTEARFLNYTNTFKFHNELNTWCWKVWKRSLNAKLRLSFVLNSKTCHFYRGKEDWAFQETEHTWLLLQQQSYVLVAVPSTNYITSKNNIREPLDIQLKLRSFTNAQVNLTVLFIRCSSLPTWSWNQNYTNNLTLAAQSSFNIPNNVIHLFCCESVCDCLKRIFTGCRFLPLLLPWLLTVSQCPTRYNVVFRNIHVCSLQWLWF